MFDVRQVGDGFQVNMQGRWMSAVDEADARQLALLPELVKDVGDEKLSPEFGDLLERCLAACVRNGVNSVATRRLQRHLRKIRERSLC